MLFLSLINEKLKRMKRVIFSLLSRFVAGPFGIPSITDLLGQVQQTSTQSSNIAAVFQILRKIFVLEEKNANDILVSGRWCCGEKGC